MSEKQVKIPDEVGFRKNSPNPIGFKQLNKNEVSRW